VNHKSPLVQLYVDVIDDGSQVNSDSRHSIKYCDKTD